MDIDPSPTSWLASAKTSAPTPLAEQMVGQLESAYSKKSVVRFLGGMKQDDADISPFSQAMAQLDDRASPLHQAAGDGSLPG